MHSISLGIHHCLGVPLALLEMEVLLDGLLRKVVAMELLSEHPPFEPNVMIRGLESLRVEFQPA
ncbi:hypothetical protein ACIRRA_42665 [Nocardia sp. NPDC101769]|uniref:hypothetical protein n=1 Tax=Nocardia sp. NPDC101769 TaxID=3364333 RepID=UPI003818D731